VQKHVVVSTAVRDEEVEPAISVVISPACGSTNQKCDETDLFGQEEIDSTKLGDQPLKRSAIDARMAIRVSFMQMTGAFRGQPPSSLTPALPPSLEPL
jgi:hypothetical protein